MTRAIGFIAGAIALIACVAWFLVRSDETRDIAIEARVATPANRVTESASESVPAAPATDGPSRAAAVANSDTAVALAHPVPTWTTRIVDAESGQPVAGARVWIVPRSALRDARWAGLDTLVDEPMNVLERETPIGTSRADGSIDVPEPTADSVLAAHVPGSFGARHIPLEASRKNLDPRPIEIRMYRDATLRVEVVDDAGVPRTFIPVDLVMYPYEKSFTEGELVHRTLPSPGAMGASIPHARWRLAGGAKPFRDEHGSFAVRIGVSMLVNPEVSITPEHVEGSPIRIVAPPCAPIVVRLLQSNRSPWPGAGIVQAKNVRWYGQSELPLHDGDALFDAVSVTPPFTASVRPGDPNMIALEVSHPGPREPWAALLLVARAPEPSGGEPILIGRVRDVDGSLLANTEFLFVPPVLAGADSVDWMGDDPPRFTTSSTGSFRFPYTEALATPKGASSRLFPHGDTSKTRERVVIRCKNHGIGFHPEARARVVLPDPLTPDTHDLGDIRLLSTPVLVSGLVQTTTGRQIAHAFVDILTPSEQQLNVFTDVDGSFKIYDGRVDTSLARITLRASFAGMYGETLPFAVGTRDAIITLPAFGTFTIRALVDKDIEASQLKFFVGTDELGGSLDPERSRDEVTRVAGETSIRVVSRDAPDAVLASIEHVVIEDGACTRDPRLNPIDLRDRLFRIAGRVVDTNGERLVGAKVWVPGGEFAIKTDAIGRFTLTLPTRSVSLRVTADGYETIEIPDATDGVVVRLAKDS